MPKKRFSAERIVLLLHQIEVAVGRGKSTQIACCERARFAVGRERVSGMR